MYLPPSIARTVADLPCETDHIGMSSAALSRPGAEDRPQGLGNRQ